MFCTRFNRVICNKCYNISLLTFSTNYRRSRIRDNDDNVGIKKRLEIFKEENPELAKLKIDEEELDKLEAGLTTGRDLVDFHKRSLEAAQKRIMFDSIQRKYFAKAKNPNFLTWAEKEQIRELYKNQPDIWDIEKLSKSFPATPDIIKKVLKSNWKLKDKERIIKHDEQVSKNWDKLKKGDIQLEPNLEKHICAFTSRERLHHTNDYLHIEEKIPTTTRIGEFSKIISDYKYQQSKLVEQNVSSTQLIEANTTTNTSNESSSHIDLENTSSILENSNLIKLNNSTKPNYWEHRKTTTLDELRKKVKKQHFLNEYDKAFVEVAESSTETLLEVESHELELVKFKKIENKVDTLSEFINKSSKEDHIPMKIKIPNDVPKSKTYKVDDTYYDAKGRFLYRVPGMK